MSVLLAESTPCTWDVLLVNKINLLIQQGKGTIFSSCATREGEKFVHDDKDRILISG